MPFIEGFNLSVLKPSAQIKRWLRSDGAQVYKRSNKQLRNRPFDSAIALSQNNYINIYIAVSNTMDTLINVIVWVHIAFGGVGLVAFWFPVFARKGARLHRVAGQVFRWSAYGVLSAAGITVILRMVQLLAAGRGPSDSGEAWAFAFFLGYLALVTGVMINFGMGVLKHKRDLAGLNTFRVRAQAYLAGGSSLFIVAWGLYWQPQNAVLLYALAPIGILNARNILRSIKGASERQQWLLEHLGAMLGCGIAYHTAFAVFGASRFFDLNNAGWLSVLPWILPTALGVPAIVLWSRHYRLKGSSQNKMANKAVLE